MHATALTLFAVWLLSLGTGVAFGRQVRDNWWADVPAGESSAITRLCRESGKPAPFREVRAHYRKTVEERLRDKSIVAIDSEEAFRLAGQPPDKGRWRAPYLVRALRLGAGADGFTAISCGRDLLVGYTAPSGDSDRKMVRSALVVDDDRKH
jgi:hypothetical protein